uniref:Steroid 5-alpha reductase C-terminal domain-containing protein n=1 Tax=Trieres chinensis TaxID=1514140 RepID=A0A7S1YXU4_TRICV|mmetsp:Transcript_13097/g.27080  ORF Transcript_13097/g.27080 Transcript_13097/m.27080 type:complete len:322 (+) Transcript_13097:25-990(+)
MADPRECDFLLIGLDCIYSLDHPFCRALVMCAFFSVLAFTVSSASNNFSQVDKLWSVIPFLYTWMCICDRRTLLMAVLATSWGIRLTWNFNRRGGYKWPPWCGDEDYRWQVLRDGGLVQILAHPFAWILFNIIFISFYQNFLLLLIAAPSFVAWSVASSPDCDYGAKELNILDLVATLLFLVCVGIEATADNQQWEFQQEKQRKRKEGEQLVGEHADGFCQSGLFSIVRKPNYAAEQLIWVAFYMFSVAATGKKLMNWSIVGSMLLIILFQGSGWFTESITLKKYSKYAEYQKKVPLYIPTLSSLTAYMLHSPGTSKRKAA